MDDIMKRLRSLLPKRLTFKTTKKQGPDLKADRVEYPLEQVFLIASEMLSTEVSYVNQLRIIEELFHENVESENLLKDNVLQDMFSNIREIYKFHKDGLLPELQDRMTKWKEQKEMYFVCDTVDYEWPDQNVGDIFVRLAPFLNMYSKYIENFENAMNTIDKYKKKNKKFSVILENIQNSPELNQLSIQNHMLTPVQRIPRYKLLLEDYIKQLPEDSSDMENAKKGLDLVKRAANHSNDTMKRIERMKNIIRVQELLGCSIDLHNPSRELLKEGKVLKISASKGEDTLKDTLKVIKDMDRYIFLFNDMLLLCSCNSLTNKVKGGPKYKLKMKFEFDDLVINDQFDLSGENENAFSLYNSISSSTSKSSIDVLARTATEKEDWIKSISIALKSYEMKQAKLKSAILSAQRSFEHKMSTEELNSYPVLQFNYHKTIIKKVSK